MRAIREKTRPLAGPAAKRFERSPTPAVPPCPLMHQNLQRDAFAGSKQAQPRATLIALHHRSRAACISGMRIGLLT